MLLLFRAVLISLSRPVRAVRRWSMPLLAPGHDLVGVNRQVTVLAFQFGDGFSHISIRHRLVDAHAGRVPGRFRNWLKVYACWDYCLLCPAWSLLARR